MGIEDRVLVEYLRRSYHVGDGLWFVKVEEERGFGEALELDRRVWEVLAKIQARKARELMECRGNEAEALAQCFGPKLTADGHAFRMATTPEAVRITLPECPWLALLRKAGRAHLASREGETVCFTEGRTWCAEFGGEWEFDMPERACSGGQRCVMRFAALPPLPALRAN